MKTTNLFRNLLSNSHYSKQVNIVFNNLRGRIAIWLHFRNQLRFSFATNYVDVFLLLWLIDGIAFITDSCL